MSRLCAFAGIALAVSAALAPAKAEDAPVWPARWP